MTLPKNTLPTRASVAVGAGSDVQGTQPAQFNGPRGLCVDGIGNIIVADELNHCIRMISREGIVSTIAGVGKPGHRDGATRVAQFSHPAGVTVDWTDGSILVADEGNNSIRRISARGKVTTVAGTGEAGYCDGVRTAARFRSPCDVAMDWEGNILVADYWNRCVRKISPRGWVSTFLHTGEDSVASCSYPVAVDMDYKNWSVTVGTTSCRHTIRQVSTRVDRRHSETMPLNTTSTYSDRARVIDTDVVRYPCGIAVNLDSGIIAADSGTCCIYSISPTGVASILAGTGETGYRDGDMAQFSRYLRVAVDRDGYVIVSDEGNHCIRKISPCGLVCTIAGNGEAGYRDGEGVVCTATLATCAQQLSPMACCPNHSTTNYTLLSKTLQRALVIMVNPHLASTITCQEGLKDLRGIRVSFPAAFFQAIDPAQGQGFERFNE
eukprot:CAMPEP_0118951120 /NCGR_PEP_ID=MMETSP1169-20130426/52564_1 /TAXON_ID=36882 /ORGANISM="Pyramimonas obovata, Strain CCMP722" /LENGTH=436 /DNA_ID=CAMNT_0006898117 /DNA_START=1 /DNA_END=1312 /DNA_ORIENTATION=+